ncbi:non-ribosomal peptide synthetase [Ahrensia sp. 13_GOM-1096m]|uniref:non-ribosomal peptide synthetase n=1 Tax=Ahrensia sp. 13_GOM-1096m TaxID=1380380 RepID=UPI0006866F84|nr:non-ribosomal peptide synthetase [Ahrensia sp. 13_GOM-1096m]
MQLLEQQCERQEMSDMAHADMVNFAKNTYNRDRSVPAYFEATVERYPDKTAVIFDDVSLSYRDLDTVSSALAQTLVRSGIRKGDFIALLVPRSIQTVIAMLAILKAGAAYVPIDPGYPDAHINFIMSECDAKIILVRDHDRQRIAKMDNQSGAVLNLNEVIKKLDLDAAATWVMPQIVGGDIAYLMYTSGSTGKPKGVLIPHRGIMCSVVEQNQIEYRSSDRVLHCASVSFDVATTEIWGSLTNGATIIGVPDETLSVSRLAGVMRSENVTFAWLTTGLFNLFADYAKPELPHLRQMLFGGEVGSAEHARRFLNRLPHVCLINSYGPTETTTHATGFVVPADFEANFMPIGPAISHRGIHIVDTDLNILPHGCEGQLVISGDGVAHGYLKRPELTAAKFIELKTASGMVQAYLTGDNAILEQDGTVIFKGRTDRQVKINGKRIELDAIEAALRRNDTLSECAVECQGEGLNKRLVAYLRPIVGMPVNKELFAQATISRLKDTLPDFMVPALAIVLEELPLNRAGKIDRAKLPQSADINSELPAKSGDTIEDLLCALLEGILGERVTDITKNLFDLGASSLHLLRLHASIEAELNRQINVIELFRHTTISALGAYLRGDAGSSDDRITPAQRSVLRRKSMLTVRNTNRCVS